MTELEKAVDRICTNLWHEEAGGWTTCDNEIKQAILALIQDEVRKARIEESIKTERCARIDIKRLLARRFDIRGAVSWKNVLAVTHKHQSQLSEGKE